MFKFSTSLLLITWPHCCWQFYYFDFLNQSSILFPCPVWVMVQEKTILPGTATAALGSTKGYCENTSAPLQWLFIGFYCWMHPWHSEQLRDISKVLNKGATPIFHQISLYLLGWWKLEFRGNSLEYEVVATSIPNLSSELRKTNSIPLHVFFNVCFLVCT